jgi:HK97 family phage major capsid protein
VPDLMTRLRDKRAQARQAAEEVLTRASQEERDLSAEELAAHAGHVAEEREAADELDRLRDEQVAEVRAQLAAARPGAEVQHRGGHALAAELRALVGSGVTGGGAYTPTEFAGYFFDRLAASSVMLRAGIRVVRTDRDTLVVPRWTADTTAAWVAEAGTISSTDATADQITATPRKVAGLQRVSNEALVDSNPALLDVVAAGLVRACALKVDLGMLEGSGTPPEIRGLKNVSGITLNSDLGANGLKPVNLDTWASAIGSVLTANGDPAAVVMHPRTWGTLIQIKEATGSVKPVLQASAGSGGQAVERRIYGLPVLLTSQLSITETKGTSTDCSSSYVFDPSQVVAVVRSDVRVEQDSSRLFNSDESEIRAISRVDLVVPNPAAVVRIEGIRAV